MEEGGRTVELIKALGVGVQLRFEFDNVKKSKKLLKRMSTFVSHFSEVDVDIRNTKKKQKNY